MTAFQNKIVHTKEENLALMARTKKGRNPFAPKKNFCAKKKEIHKGMNRSKLICFYCKKSGHFTQHCNIRKIKEGRIHASTAVGGEPSQEKSSKEEDD